MFFIKVHPLKLKLRIPIQHTHIVEITYRGGIFLSFYDFLKLQFFVSKKKTEKNGEKNRIADKLKNKKKGYVEISRYQIAKFMRRNMDFSISHPLTELDGGIKPGDRPHTRRSTTRMKTTSSLVKLQIEL